MPSLTRFCMLVVLAFIPALAGAQTAANYPSRPIRVIVPFGPGGPTDIFGRLYASHLEKKYKQPAIVENKPGGGQIVATDFVVKAPADGYTLLTAANTLTYESLLNKDAPFDSTKDILPYGVIGGSGLFIAVNAGLPVKTIQEFVAWVKANPGKLNVGTVGVPTVEMEGLRDKLGLNWTNVNYKGGVAAQTALMAGEINLYTPDLNQTAPAVKDGRIKVLAFGDRQRHPGMPDVPTVAESGIGAPDFLMYVWLGMFAASGVPNDIVNKLHADVIEMQGNPDVQSKINAMGWRTNPIGVEELRKLQQASNENVKSLLAKGIKLR